MSLRSLFGTNKELEETGIWVEYHDSDDKAVGRFKIGRINSSNKKYAKALEKQTKKHRRLIELEQLNSELGKALFLNIFVDTILIDWEIVVVDDEVDAT